MSVKISLRGMQALCFLAMLLIDGGEISLVLGTGTVVYRDSYPAHVWSHLTCPLSGPLFSLPS